MADKRFDNRPQKPKLNSLPERPDEARGRFPAWLHRRLPRGKELFHTSHLLKTHGLHTVCEEAKCPNRLECYTNKTATFLALGSACTRACGFCDIDFAKTPKPPDDTEPTRIAQAVQQLGLQHVVITMVARDDLPDQGASHIAHIIQAIRTHNAGATVEVLTSDFSGETSLLDIVLEAGPEIFNHNIETVRRLTPKVRHKATYERTLHLLQYVARAQKVPFVKSGIMVGLGETSQEVEETIKDLHTAGCAIITIGQYLQPSHRKLGVKSFVKPELFKEWETYGQGIGVKHMYCGPLVRSSYNASLLKDRAFQPTSSKS